MRPGEALSWIKSHPYVDAGAVFVVGAILVYLYYSGSSTAAAPQANSADAYLAAQLQSESVQAQYGAQLQAQQSQEAAAANAVAGQVQIAGLQAGNASQSIAAQQTVDLAQIGASQAVSLANIGANETISLGSIAAGVDQTALLTGFLNNEVQTNASVQNNEINALANMFLSNSEYAQLEGQIGGINNFDTATAGQIDTLQGNVGNLASNTQALLNYGNVKSGWFDWSQIPGFNPSTSPQG
jgi:hypothetical protein